MDRRRWRRDTPVHLPPLYLWYRCRGDGLHRPAGRGEPVSAPTLIHVAGDEGMQRLCCHLSPGGWVWKVPVDTRDSHQFTWIDDGQSEPAQQLRLRNTHPLLQPAAQSEPVQPVSHPPGNSNYLPGTCTVYTLPYLHQVAAILSVVVVVVAGACTDNLGGRCSSQKRGTINKITHIKN